MTRISARETEACSSRSVLILQGPLSDYYSMIGEELAALGARVRRINFCGSDAHNWKLAGARNYTDTPENWSAFLERFVLEHGITDILLHGDRRFYHKCAIEVAKQLGLTVIATELGYLRPNWMTLEKGGCSTLSHFPNDPARIIEISKRVSLPSTEQSFSSKWTDQITQELSFTFQNLLRNRSFPHYLSHRRESRLEVYSGWLKAQLLKRRRKRRGEKAFKTLLRIRQPFYVAALQLNGDFQIRDHSGFESSVDVMEHIVASFAKHAPQNAHLALKPHPLEYRDRWLRQALNTFAKKYNLTDRLHWIYGVSIGQLCREAAGFVTLNSSAGFEALEHGCPTCAIMPTLYDMKGLTFQGDLDAFWHQAAPPDLRLYSALTRAIAGTIQVPGGLYSEDGRRAAAKNSAYRIANELVNEPEAFESTPPRLEKARAQGVDLSHWQPKDRKRLQPELV